jgi:hypothetical protein
LCSTAKIDRGMTRWVNSAGHDQSEP